MKHIHKAMTTKQAHKKAVSIWGKNACVQDRRRVTSPSLRESARHEQRELIDRLRTQKGHKSNWTSAERMKVQDLCAALMDFRFSVGKIEMGMFFAVKGSGDTFEEAFADYERKEAADRERYAALKK